MNGDRASDAPDNPDPKDPLLAEVEALRAEVLRLRRQEQRHLSELAQFARIAEGKRFGWPQVRGVAAGWRQRAASWLRRLKRGIIARMPAPLKARLRRLQTRYFS